MSYRPEVIADATGKWYANGLRFATYEEAYASASELAGRWMAVRDFRVVESDDPVNYRIVDGKLEHIE
jgi:hypothetical protein